MVGQPVSSTAAVRPVLLTVVVEPEWLTAAAELVSSTVVVTPALWLGQRLHYLSRL